MLLAVPLVAGPIVMLVSRVVAPKLGWLLSFGYGLLGPFAFIASDPVGGGCVSIVFAAFCFLPWAIGTKWSRLVKPRTGKILEALGVATAALFWAMCAISHIWPAVLQPRRL